MEQTAYVLATVELETATTFEPVREAFWKSEEWRKQHLARYYPYYGRGYVQITWRANYKKFSDLLGLDLVNEPDLALDPAVAIQVLIIGFRDGLFTTKKIGDYINEHRTDFRNARRCINGLDRADHIAALAERWLKKLSAQKKRTDLWKRFLAAKAKLESTYNRIIKGG